MLQQRRKEIPAQDQQEIKQSVPLLSLLRGGALMALAYADYGVTACSEAMFNQPHDTSADNQRRSVAASAPDEYVAQVGDMAVTVSGTSYRIVAAPDGRGGRLFDDTSITPYSGRVSHHVLTVCVPLRPAADLFPEQRAAAEARLEAGGHGHWGLIEPDGTGGYVYVTRRAYSVRGPDPQAAHDLLLRPDARPLRLMQRTLTHAREHQRFAAHHLTLDTDRPLIHAALHVD